MTKLEPCTCNACKELFLHEISDPSPITICPDCIKDVFIAQARKYNGYSETVPTAGRRCIGCIRWRLSYPYTCNDHDMYGNRAETCLNWTDDKNCPVD